MIASIMAGVLYAKSAAPTWQAMPSLCRRFILAIPDNYP